MEDRVAAFGLGTDRVAMDATIQNAKHLAFGYLNAKDARKKR